MKKFLVALGLLPVMMGYAQEEKEKGLFGRVAVAETELVGAAETFYSADVAALSKSWASSDFRQIDGVYSTGNYKPNDTLAAVSPVMELPAVDGKEKLYLKVNEEFHTESDYDFVMTSVSEDNGKTYRRICRRSGVADVYDEYSDLTPWAGKKVRVKFSLVSDGSVEGKGWNIKGVSVEKHMPISQQTFALRSSNFSVASAVHELEYLGFEQPSVGKLTQFKLYISASTSDGDFVPGLKASDLEVRMGKNIIDESCISLERLNDYSNQAVDIAFLIDHSGSMQDDMDGVADNIEALVENIGTSMDASAGIYRFGFGGVASCPKEQVMWGPDFFLNIADKNDVENPNRGDFIAKWRSYEASGSYEPYYGVLNDMAEGMSLNYRKTSQKVIIFIGDEDAIDGTNEKDCPEGTVYAASERERLIKKLNGNFQLFTIVKPGAGFDGMAVQTGGRTIDIDNNSGYEAIIEAIGDKLKERYVVTIDFAKCGLQPDSCLEVKVGETTSGEICLDIVPQPTIKRTESTMEYDVKSVKIGSGDEKVGVSVEGLPEGETVDSVEVYLANVKDKNFKGYVTEAKVGDGYYVNVPSDMLEENAVICYYFRVYVGDEYYIYSSPDGLYPYGYWTVTVAPNEPPMFGEPSVTVNGVCQPSQMCVTLSDKNDNLQKDKVFMYYRKKGSSDEYVSHKMAESGNGVYCASAPAPYSVAPGIEYFFSAEDELGSLTYKGTSEIPLIEEISAELPESEKGAESGVTLNVNQENDCASEFMSGDEIFAYFDNGCGGQSLGGYAKVSGNVSVLDIETLFNSSDMEIRNGFENGDRMFIQLLRGGTLYDISTESSVYEDYSDVSVSLPSMPMIDVKSDWWREVPNGSETVSYDNNTYFGFAQTAVKKDFIINNPTGCGAVEISAEVSNKHFTLSDTIFKLENYEHGVGFSIEYDGEEDARGIVTLHCTGKGEDGSKFSYDYTFAVEGRSTVPFEPCDGVTIDMPLSDKDRLINIKVGSQNGWVSVYVVDSQGRVQRVVYNGYAANDLSLDLRNAVQDLPKTQTYFVVVEREGLGGCSSRIIVE